MKTFGTRFLLHRPETVDLRYVEQLADSEQTSALAYLTRHALEQLLTDGKLCGRLRQNCKNGLRQKAGTA